MRTNIEPNTNNLLQIKHYRNGTVLHKNKIESNTYFAVILQTVNTMEPIFNKLPEDVKHIIVDYSVELQLLEKIDEINKSFSNYLKYVINCPDRFSKYNPERKYNIEFEKNGWNVLCRLYAYIPKLYSPINDKKKWVNCEEKHSLESLLWGRSYNFSNRYNLKIPCSELTTCYVSRKVANTLFIIHGFPFEESEHRLTDTIRIPRLMFKVMPKRRWSKKQIQDAGFFIGKN